MEPVQIDLVMHAPKQLFFSLFQKVPSALMNDLFIYLVWLVSKEMMVNLFLKAREVVDLLCNLSRQFRPILLQ